MVKLSAPVFQPGEVDAMIAQILNEEQKAEFAQQKNLDFSFKASGIGIFRVNLFQQRHGASIVMRVLTEAISKLDRADLMAKLDAVEAILDLPETHVERVDFVAHRPELAAQLGADVWCVGGSPEAVAAAGFGTQLHAALFTNPMGLGPAAYRDTGRVGPVGGGRGCGWAARQPAADRSCGARDESAAASAATARSAPAPTKPNDELRDSDLLQERMRALLKRSFRKAMGRRPLLLPVIWEMGWKARHMDSF